MTQDIFYTLKALSVKNVKNILIQANKEGEKTLVDMLVAHKSFARVKADKSFQEVLELLNEDSLEYFRIILRKNQNLFGILTNQAIVKDILEIAIRGIDIDRKEYFIFIYLDKNKLDDLKKRYVLKEIGGGFLVKFHSPEDLLSLIPEKGKVDLRKLGLNERQVEALRLVVNEGKVFTNKKYSEKFDVSNKTAATDLNQMVKLGEIISEGRGRNVKYYYTINKKNTRLTTRLEEQSNEVEKTTNNQTQIRRKGGLK